MKSKFKYFFVLSTILLYFSSCKKDEKQVTFLGGTEPVLSASVANVIPLDNATKSEPAATFTWTNPNFKFNTGVSSQTVTYTLELDTTGANFKGAKKQTIPVTVQGALNTSITQDALNAALLKMDLEDSVPHNIEFRLKAALGSTAAFVYSNVLKFKATPYDIPPVVAPPAAGTLYITGSATPKGWMGGGDAPVVSQKFVQDAKIPTLYTIDRITLQPGSYLLVPRYGNWSAVSPDPEKYGWDGKNNENNQLGDALKRSGGDIKAPDAAGDYKIVVDFKKGQFNLTKL